MPPYPNRRKQHQSEAWCHPDFIAHADDRPHGVYSSVNRRHSQVGAWLVLDFVDRQPRCIFVRLKIDDDAVHVNENAVHRVLTMTTPIFSS